MTTIPCTPVPAEAQAGLTAHSVGACVPQNAHGTVHSVFRRACNVELDSGDLVTLLGLELGNVPSGIRCLPQGVSFPQRLRPGQAATIVNGMLCVPEARLRVDFSRTPVWDCQLPGIDLRKPATRHALHELHAALCRYMPTGGFSPLLFAPNGAQTHLERSIAARLRGALPALARGVRQHRADEITAALSRIIGLGVGLTPSGDDFIAGYMAALWSRALREPGLGALLCELASPLAPLAQRTGAISRQQLVDAVHGRFAQRLVEVLHALVRNESVAERARQVLVSGHSSGADTLCGLLSGLSPAQMTCTPPPLRNSRSLVVVGRARTAMLV